MTAETNVLDVDATCTSANVIGPRRYRNLRVGRQCPSSGTDLMALDYNKIIFAIVAPAPSTIVTIHCERDDEVQVRDRIMDPRPN